MKFWLNNGKLVVSDIGTMTDCPACPCDLPGSGGGSGVGGCCEGFTLPATTYLHLVIDGTPVTVTMNGYTNGLGNKCWLGRGGSAVAEICCVEGGFILTYSIKTRGDGGFGCAGTIGGTLASCDPLDFTGNFLCNGRPVTFEWMP